MEMSCLVVEVRRCVCWVIQVLQCSTDGQISWYQLYLFKLYRDLSQPNGALAFSKCFFRQCSKCWIEWTRRDGMQWTCLIRWNSATVWLIERGIWIPLQRIQGGKVLKAILIPIFGPNVIWWILYQIHVHSRSRKKNCHPEELFTHAYNFSHLDNVETKWKIMLWFLFFSI